MSPRIQILLAAAALSAVTAMGLAQAVPPYEPPGNPATRPAERNGREPMGFGRGGRMGGFDMFNGMQARLSATDEEWKVIGPMLQRVSAARRVAESGVDPEAEAQAEAGGDNLQFAPGGGRGFDPRGDRGFGRGFRGAPGADTFTPATQPVDANAPANPATRPAEEGVRGRRGFGGPSDGFPGNGGPGGGRFGGPGGNRDGFGGPGTGGPGGNPFGGFGGGGGGRGGPGGPGGGPGGFGRGNAVTSAIADLRTTLADKNATPEQVKEKVAAVRAARAKANADLAAAQQELHELLTTDQEAVLVCEGLLD